MATAGRGPYSTKDRSRLWLVNTCLRCFDVCVTWPLVVQDARAGTLYIARRRTRLSSPPTARGSPLPSFFLISKRDGGREIRKRGGEKGRRISRKIEGEGEGESGERAGGARRKKRVTTSCGQWYAPCKIPACDLFDTQRYSVLIGIRHLAPRMLASAYWSKRSIIFFIFPTHQKLSNQIHGKECFWTLKDDLLLNYQPDIDLKGIYMILETQIRTIP